MRLAVVKSGRCKSKVRWSPWEKAFGTERSTMAPLGIRPALWIFTLIHFSIYLFDVLNTFSREKFTEIAWFNSVLTDFASKTPYITLPTLYNIRFFEILSCQLYLQCLLFNFQEKDFLYSLHFPRYNEKTGQKVYFPKVTLYLKHMATKSYFIHEIIWPKSR